MYLFFPSLPPLKMNGFSINDSVSMIQYQSFGSLFLLNYLMREIPINNQKLLFWFSFKPCGNIEIDAFTHISKFHTL